jgi:hypothetical protein
MNALASGRFFMQPDMSANDPKPTCKKENRRLDCDPTISTHIENFCIVGFISA